MGADIMLAEYLKKNEIEITLFPENKTKKFTSLNEFYTFIEREWEFWEDCTNGNVNEIREHFINIKTMLKNAIDQINNYDSSIQLLNKAINEANINNVPCIYSITEHGQKLKALNQENYISSNGFYDALSQGSLNDLSDYKYLYGVIEAFKLFSGANTDIIAKENLLKELSSRYSSGLDKLDREYAVRRDLIDQEFTSFSNEIKEWQEMNVHKLNDFYEEKKLNLESLEKTYNEHMKLKAPAQHWDELFITYEKTGNLWRKWAIGTASVLMIFLTAVLFHLPSELKVNLDAVNFITVRSILILTIIISIGIYLLRLFVKLSMSAYHLSRDAKERYQLTYFYLSLIYESAIENTDRSIVFQALFSRADTGLLKGDSSPTIPDGMMQQIMKLVKS